MSQLYLTEHNAKLGRDGGVFKITINDEIDMWRQSHGSIYRKPGN